MKTNYKYQKGELLIVEEKERISQVQIEDISHIECEDYISIIKTIDKRKILVSRPISSFENELSEIGFCRINRNSIINLSNMISFCKKPKPIVVMENKEEISISRRRLQRFIKRLKNQ